MIDICIVSADLFTDVLDVRGRRGTELSTDLNLRTSRWNGHCSDQRSLLQLLNAVDNSG